jgi:hypothetical protein
MTPNGLAHIISVQAKSLFFGNQGGMALPRTDFMPFIARMQALKGAESLFILNFASPPHVRLGRG